MDSILLIHVRMEQVEYLEGMFAVLTPNGWVIPDWLVLMRAQTQENENAARQG